MSQYIPYQNSTRPLIAGPVVQAADGRTAMPGLLAAGTDLTAAANGSTTTFVTAAAPGLSVGQVIAFVSGANSSGYRYVTGVTGSGPYTTTFSPAATSTTSGDVVLATDIGFTLNKAGGGFNVPLSTALTDTGDGYYTIGGNATDEGTIGELLLHWDVYGSTPGVSNEKTYDVEQFPTDASIATDVQTGLTAQGYTTARAGFLDTLNGVVASIWNAALSGMTTAGSVGKMLANLLFDGSGYIKANAEAIGATGADFNNTGQTSNVPATVEGYASGQDPATLVLGATAASWDTASTIGAKINSAASGSDPWATALPGGYTTGQAGNILGNNLNASVSGVMSRLGTPAGASVSADIAIANAALLRLLGLTGQNVAIDGMTYSGSVLTAASIWVYDTKAHALNNDHSTGLLFSYTISGTASGGNTATQITVMNS